MFTFYLKSSTTELRKFPMPKKQEEIKRLTEILGRYFGRYREAAAYNATQAFSDHRVDTPKHVDPIADSKTTLEPEEEDL